MQHLKGSKADLVDIVLPTREDTAFLKRRYDIPEVILNELLRPSARQRVDRGKNYIYLVLHLPIYQPEQRTSQPFEIDFILTRRAFITARYGRFEPLDKFLISCSADPKFAKKCFDSDPLELFFAINEQIFDFLLRELVHINEKITVLEEIVFREKTQSFIKDLLFVKQDILVFRRSIREIQPILESLIEELRYFFPTTRIPIGRFIMGQYLRVLRTIEEYKESIESLENTHASVVNISMSTVMKVLAVVSFIVLPANLVLNLLDLYYYTRQPSTFEHAVIIFTVVAIILLSFIIVKKRKWI